MITPGSERLFTESLQFFALSSANPETIRADITYGRVYIHAQFFPFLILAERG
jgi:hypothetical protein